MRTANETKGSMRTRQRRIIIQRWITMSFKGTSDLKAKTGANVAEHTWVPSEMIQKPIQPGFPTPTRPAPGNAISTKATTLPIQDFLSFHAATSRGNIDEEERLTADSLNAFTEWFFAGFTMSLARRQTRREERGL